MFNRLVIKANDLLLHLRRPRCAPGEVLILIPSCLQSSKCRQRVSIEISECRRCGNCGVGDIVALGEKVGLRVACATGGRLALALVKSPSVKAVIAVACEKELRAGLMGVFPKPVISVCNSRPNGPCRDTQVDMEMVCAAVEKLTGVSCKDLGRDPRRQQTDNAEPKN